ncbi:hypothetical protein TNIN_482121, partial [Trichonephila inaurata madagascariensis]
MEQMSSGHISVTKEQCLSIEVTDILRTTACVQSF